MCTWYQSVGCLTSGLHQQASLRLKPAWGCLASALRAQAVCTGFRGGLIFPSFLAGTALGQAMWLGTQDVWFLRDLPPVLPCMTIAAGELTDQVAEPNAMIPEDAQPYWQALRL